MQLGNGSVIVAAAVLERPLFALDLQTLISVGVQLLNVLILAIVLRFIIYKPVRKFLSNRSEKIKEQLNAAEDGVSNANGLIEQYEQKLSELEAERDGVLEKARSQATAVSENMINEANDEIAALRTLADAEIRREHERIDAEMKEYVISIASHMAGKIIEHSLDENTLDKLFQESIAELESAL